MTQNDSVEILNSYQKLWTEHLALRAERDALRAQLDGMTTETHGLGYKRLVGPWVEVTD